MKDLNINRAIIYLKPFLFYVLTAIILTYPIFLHMGTSVNNISDNLGLPWFAWIFHNNIEQSKPLLNFSSDHTWYPYQTDLKLSWDSPLYYAAYFLLHIFASPFFINNFLTLLYFVLNAFFLFFVLYKYFKHSYIGSFVGGFIFGFSSYFLSQSLNLQGGFFMPLLLLFCLQYNENSSKWNFVKILACVFLSGLLSFVYFFYSLLFLFVFSAIFKNWQLLKRSLLLYIAVIIFMSVFLGKGLTNSPIDDKEQVLLSGTVFDFFIPDRTSLFFKSFKSNFAPFYNSAGAENVFLGYLEISLFIFFLVYYKKLNMKIPEVLKYKKLIILGLIFMILAFGPVLRINILYPPNPTDITHQIVLPYYFLMHIPPFDLIRYSRRLSIFFVLILAIIISLIITKTKPNKLYLSVFIIIFFLERFIYPYPVYSVSMPQIFSEWAKESSHFNVMNIPLGPVMSALPLYDQTVHHKKLLGGLIGARVFKTEDFKRFFFSDKVRPYFSCQAIENSPIIVTDQEFRDFLTKNSVGFIVVYKNDLNVEDCIQKNMEERIDSAILKKYSTIYEDQYRQILQVE